MAKTLDIENELPRKLGFKGRYVELLPGPNSVDEDTFLKLWATDPTIKALYEQRAFTIEKDGKPWEPEEGAKQLRKTPKELTGPSHRTVSTMKPAPSRPEPPAAPPEKVAAPNRVGAAGVPGTVPEATKLIAETDDVDQLTAWFAKEERAGVLPALEARLADLGALAGD